MRLTSSILATSLLLVTSFSAMAQQPQKDTTENDLMGLLDSEEGKPKTEYTTATFKTTRLVNGHSIENVAKGVLDFRVLHRFGEIKDAKNFFGLDGATTALAFDYGVTDWLMVGITRHTFEKEFQGYVKSKVLRQTDTKGMPLSLSYYGSFSIQTAQPPILPPGQEYLLTNRLFYVNQLLVARKFSNVFSLQLMPTHIHYNLVPTSAEPNNTMAIGAGGRLKLTNRISLNAEYFYRLPSAMLKGYRNSFSVGFDLETGGHVFQLMFSNATTSSERVFIGQTVSDWAKGGIHFGFNISRVFTIVRPKELEGMRNKIW
jgi:hypothetical protein